MAAYLVGLQPTVIASRASPPLLDSKNRGRASPVNRLPCAHGPSRAASYNYYSAGKRDRGKNSSVPLARAQYSPSSQGQGGAEGPDAGPIAEEGAEGPRRLGRTSAPLGKSFRRKLKTRQRYYTRLRKNRKSAI